MRYSVPVTYTISASIDVEAENEEEAIAAARKKYSELGLNSFTSRAVDVDFANGEEPDDVEEAVDDD